MWCVGNVAAVGVRLVFVGRDRDGKRRPVLETIVVDKERVAGLQANASGPSRRPYRADR